MFRWRNTVDRAGFYTYFHFQLNFFICEELWRITFRFKFISMHFKLGRKLNPFSNSCRNKIRYRTFNLYYNGAVTRAGILIISQELCGFTCIKMCAALFEKSMEASFIFLLNWENLVLNYEYHNNVLYILIMIL